MAQFHRAQVAETEGKYGEWVGRLQYAESLAKETLKAGKDLTGMAGLSQLIGSITASSSASSGSKKDTSASMLSDSMKAFHAFMEKKAAQALKENDLIYHESIPASSTLPPLDKMPMSQQKKLTEVFTHLPSIVGEDLFAQLVPFEVHEKSRYCFDSTI